MIKRHDKWYIIMDNEEGQQEVGKNKIFNTDLTKSKDPGNRG